MSLIVALLLCWRVKVTTRLSRGQIKCRLTDAERQETQQTFIEKACFVIGYLLSYVVYTTELKQK